MWGDPGDDVLVAGRGRSELYGSAGADRLRGSGIGDSLCDRIFGRRPGPLLTTLDGRGGDVIRGNGGRDSYSADTGDSVYAERGLPDPCDVDR